MKYLVMECHEQYAVLLDEEACFVRAKNTGLMVGETIEDPQLLNDAPSRRRNIIMTVTCVMATAAACIAVVLGINHYREYVTPYSNIRLSINPDVEMTLNHHGQVLSVKGLNEDGEMLVEGYKPKRRDKIVVADELIERAIDMGYLSDDAIIIFDIDTPDKELLTQYGIELRSEAEIYTREFANVNIIIIDRNDDTADDYDYREEDYEPIVIPLPTEAETLIPETAPPATELEASDSGYAEPDDGDTPHDPEDGNSPYGEDDAPATSLPAPTNPVTVPAETTPPATLPSAGDSGYSDSGYGDSAYSGDSGYDTDD